MVTAFHRLAVWPHMRVSDDNAGHEEPLIAAVYNNTFQVVGPPTLLGKRHLSCCTQVKEGQRGMSDNAFLQCLSKHAMAMICTIIEGHRIVMKGNKLTLTQVSRCFSRSQLV